MSPSAPSPSALDAVIKAYDIRGVVPDQITPELVRNIGAAFTRIVGAHGSAIVIGEDMRPSSPVLAGAFAEGAQSQGADVVRIGLASTDMLYYASGALGLPGAMFTASHNPAQYNGIKLCRAGASPIGQDSGLRAIRDLLLSEIPNWEGEVGSSTEKNVLDDYVSHLLKLVNLDQIRPLRIVIDAGNGMAGHTAPAVFSRINADVIPLFFELDGSFPNHEANPIEPENLQDLQRAVLTHHADLGLAFDGDADRCFIVDEKGQIVSPSALTGLIAARELRRVPGSSIIHNLITSQSVPEIIRERGGLPVRTRVGHSFIKETMASTNAVFGGEHSGHFYFRDFWRADSGMLAALHAIAELGQMPATAKFSEIVAEYDRYPMSGEINSTVTDAQSALARIVDHFTSKGATLDELDGITITGEGWWFNVRPSNTEPLLRLNVEAGSDHEMARVRDEVLALIREEK
jgi:phosphomannomutase